MFKLWAVQWSSENSFIAHELDAMRATKFQATAAIIASRQGSSSSSYRLGSGITLVVVEARVEDSGARSHLI